MNKFRRLGQPKSEWEIKKYVFRRLTSIKADRLHFAAIIGSHRRTQYAASSIFIAIINESYSKINILHDQVGQRTHKRKKPRYSAKRESYATDWKGYLHLNQFSLSTSEEMSTSFFSRHCHRHRLKFCPNKQITAPFDTVDDCVICKTN